MSIMQGIFHSLQAIFAMYQNKENGDDEASIVHVVALYTTIEGSSPIDASIRRKPV